MITVWNTGAVAMFGYRAEDMIGKPFEAICAESSNTLSISEARRTLRPASVVEFDGRRSNGEVFPVEASFSGWQGTEGYQYGAILRDISVRKHEAEKIRYLAEYDTLTGLRQSLHARRQARCNDRPRRGRTWARLPSWLSVSMASSRSNDMLGHANGDLVPRAVAERLKLQVGSGGRRRTPSVTSSPLRSAAPTWPRAWLPRRSDPRRLR